MRYDSSTYRKHKRPGSWGTPCPDDIAQTDAEELLLTSVEVEGKRFNVAGSHCFQALQHDVDADGASLWHGHPIPWSRLPTAAKRQLIATGRLDASTFRKALRKGWGAGFET